MSDGHKQTTCHQSVGDDEDEAPSIFVDMGPVPLGVRCDWCGDADSEGYINWSPPDGPLLCNRCDHVRSKSENLIKESNALAWSLISHLAHAWLDSHITPFLRRVSRWNLRRKSRTST